jgi:hydrogenase-1 operon protein HyaE
MSSPLIDRLTSDLGWPRLETMEAVDAFLARPGTHALLVPGDPARNLETNDAAVIVPEVVRAFGAAFDVAVVAEPVERAVRERFDTWPTPSLIFVREGAFLGAIPKVRDWDDYLERTRLILAGRATAAA